MRDVRPPIREDILLALADFRGDFGETRTALVRELTPGWILDEDIRTHNRVLVMSKGQEITEAAVLALRRMHAAHAVEKPVTVRYQTGNAR
jgi:hypothetical protein